MYIAAPNPEDYQHIIEYYPITIPIHSSNKSINETISEAVKRGFPANQILPLLNIINNRNSIVGNILLYLYDITKQPGILRILNSVNEHIERKISKDFRETLDKTLAYN